MSQACPCGDITHPAVIVNPPGLSVIRYRIGDFVSFREALLKPLRPEVGLGNWRPGTREDLALQILEWWAYLADILTFYEERSAQQRYLRTADLPENVVNMVRLLGYRPRPGIGATGQVAALIKGPKSLTIPAGYQIQSKPGPGQTPQIFEVDKATVCSLPDLVPADAAPHSAVVSSVLLAGQDPVVVVGEQLLFLAKGPVTPASARFVTVSSVAMETDPRGIKNTRIAFAPALPSNGGAETLRLLRSSNSIGLWPYSGTAVNATTVHLASLAREVHSGDVAVFHKTGSDPVAVAVVGNAEVIWYARTTGDPATPDTVPIPILHSLITFSGTIDHADLQSNRDRSRLLFGYRDIGSIIPAPATEVAGPTLSFTPSVGQRFPILSSSAPVLISAGMEGGAAGAVSVSTSSALTLRDAAASAIAAPFDALFNVLPVSRGKSVSREILGGGDAAVSGQEFTLKKSPLTYLAASGPQAPLGYTSTLRVYVDGIQWQEAASFYGAGPQDRIFVTKEDTENKTHILFGDGLRGARLPSGVGNITAYYRYESGAELPDAGKLNVMLQPIPGLRGIRNPVQPSGGSDPDPADRLKELAPKTVLTFGRAVSAADYEAIAAATPGVDRARAYWSFDAVRQQSVVTVYVGDTAGAVAAAQAALAGAADPNRPLIVKQATAVPVAMLVRVRMKAGYLPENVEPGVLAALIDPDTGLLGVRTVRIGQTLFQSQIFGACQSVAGVESVTLLAFVRQLPPYFYPEPYRAFAGEGQFFSLAPTDVNLFLEEAHA